MFQSMHELDRRSHRISEEPSSEHNIQKMIELQQQVLFDIDHQRYCILKLQRSQQKTVSKMQTLMEQLQTLQQQILHTMNASPKLGGSNRIESGKIGKETRWYQRIIPRCFSPPTN